MIFEIEIPDDKLNEFKEYFLYIYPIPVDKDTQQPLYTAIEWFQRWLRRQVIKTYKKGKRNTLRDELEITYELEE